MTMRFIAWLYFPAITWDCFVLRSDGRLLRRASSQWRFVYSCPHRASSQWRCFYCFVVPPCNDGGLFHFIRNDVGLLCSSQWREIASSCLLAMAEMEIVSSCLPAMTSTIKNAHFSMIFRLPLRYFFFPEVVPVWIHWVDQIYLFLTAASFDSFFFGVGFLNRKVTEIVNKLCMVIPCCKGA